jgi:hypothetical protein
VAHTTEGAPCGLAELPIVLGTNIRQFVLLPVGPDVLHRIQFRSVGGKILDLDSAIELDEIVAHQTAAVGRQAVPDQKQRLANVPHQRLQKIDDLRTPDRTDVQAGREAQESKPSDCRQTQVSDGRLRRERDSVTSFACFKRQTRWQ